MTKIFSGPFAESIDTYLKRAGYLYHCTEEGKFCYHRRLNDLRFPRFHVYVAQKNNKVQISLHIDAQDSLNHRGNHKQPWAYHGGRIEQEMSRISDSFEGQLVAQVSGAKHLKKIVPSPSARKRLLDLFVG